MLLLFCLLLLHNNYLFNQLVDFKCTCMFAPKCRVSLFMVRAVPEKWGVFDGKLFYLFDFKSKFTTLGIIERTPLLTSPVDILQICSL